MASWTEWMPIFPSSYSFYFLSFLQSTCILL